MKNKNGFFIKVFVAIAYLAMVFVNALANTLPINNMTTGDISDKYSNLFAPAAITFSIWALIYLLLAAYVVNQLGLFQKNKDPDREVLFNKIGIYFILSSLVNISWIFSWHYDLIWLSVVFMFFLLFCLIKIADTLKKEKFSFKDKFLTVAPFRLYFGWITVATIANVTVFLVSIGWDGFGMLEYFWTILILLVGAGIGIIRTLKDKDLIYGLVFVWAYVGILIKHLSTEGFAGQYERVVITLISCLFVFLFFGVSTFINKKRELIL